MACLRDRLHKLADDAAPVYADLDDILGDHLPAEARRRVNVLLGEIWSNGLAAGEEEAREVYAVLRRRLPEHLPVIEEAFKSVLFDGSVCDDVEWGRWIEPLDEPPPLRLIGRDGAG